MAKLFCTLVVLLAAASAGSAKDLKRSKRQLQVYYMCNGGVSQYPCNTNTNCNYNNCNNYNSYGNNQVVLPTSFYNPNINCNSNCNNLNCNQYSGSWINGQYVAYSMGSNVYSPCASSCCSNNNNYYNAYTSGNNGIYTPYNNLNNLPINGNLQNNVNSQYMPYGAQSFTGTYQNGVFMCGATEPSGGVCANNGVCPSGHSCVAGNVCCRCPVGASAGNCRTNTDCTAGYKCSGTGYCCPSQIAADTQLMPCINGACVDSSFTCGVGDLCYPAGFFQ